MSTVGVKCRWTTCQSQVNSGHDSPCILHDPDENKDQERFDADLELRIKAQQEDSEAEEIDLSGVVFPREAQFSNTIFEKRVNFARAKFLQGADFTDARFIGDGYFSGAEFHGEACFIEAEFKDEAYFRYVSFPLHASFAHVVFAKEAYFRSAHFPGSADFWNALFEGAAYFWNSNFAGGADFWHANFKISADFWGAQFGGDAYFTGTTFGGDVDFTRALVRSSLNFLQTSFPTEEGRGVVRFHFLTPDSAKDVRFEHVDMSRVSFLRTDVSKVYFVACTWPQPKRPDSVLWPLPISWLPQRRTVVYDEEALEELERAVKQVKRTHKEAFGKFKRSIGKMNRASDAARVKIAGKSLEELKNTCERGTHELKRRADLIRRDHAETLRGLKEKVDLLSRTEVEALDELESEINRVAQDHHSAFGGLMKRMDKLELDHEAAFWELENEVKRGESSRGLVADVYRQLRINLEGTRQEIEAADFYIGQMKMRRRDSSYDLIYRVLLAVYRIVGMYGQSYWRPMVWYALILSPLFMLGYRALGLSYSEGLFTALMAGTILQGAPVPAGIESWEKLVVHFNMFYGIFLLGVTLVAFNRRFRR